MVAKRRSPARGLRSAAGADLKLDELETVLGHRFKDRAVLMSALSHSSLTRRGGGQGFDRMEFLGDRVVGLILADLLLERHPDDGEGDIARRHARLVNRDSLARIARDIHLGQYLRLSAGEVQSGGSDNPAVLADAFEAVVAALYRDGGLDAARAFLTTRVAELMSEVTVPPRDAKTALQEWAQARGLALPAYRLVKMSGPAHKPRIAVEVQIDGLPAEAAEGASKREAEQAAAAALLKRAQTQVTR
jgi:ribonuclease III